MMYTVNKDLRKFLNRCERSGCRIEKGNNHLKLYTPDGNLITLSGTPRNPIAAIGDITRRLRREGIEIVT